MYGQTTSGKTYSMLGHQNDPGILPCSLRDIFTIVNKNRQLKYSIKCSYVEIHNEIIHDLLTNETNLKIKDDSKVIINYYNIYLYNNI